MDFKFSSRGMVRACAGAAGGGAACCFGPSGRTAQPKPGHERCTWCDPENVRRACGSAGGRARLKQLLRNMQLRVRRLALARLPAEIHAEHFAAEFGPADSAAEEEEVLSEADSLEAELDAAVDVLLAAEGLDLDLGEGIGCAQPRALHPEEGSEGYVESPRKAGVDAARPSGDADAPRARPAPPPRRLRGKQPDPAGRPRAAVAQPAPAALLRPAAGAAVIAKKPAAQGTRPSKQCPGQGDAPCIFSTTQARQPARIQPLRGEVRCCFCDASAFDRAAASARPCKC